MPTNKPFDELALERHAYNMRRMICETIIHNGEGHGGPALSCTDILAVLYMNVMKIDIDVYKRQPYDGLQHLLIMV